MAEIRLVALDTKGKPEDAARIKKSCDMAFRNYSCGRCHISTNSKDFKLYAEIVFFANAIADNKRINPKKDSAAFLEDLAMKMKRLIPTDQLKKYEERFNALNKINNNLAQEKEEN